LASSFTSGDLTVVQVEEDANAFLYALLQAVPWPGIESNKVNGNGRQTYSIAKRKNNESPAIHRISTVQRTVHHPQSDGFTIDASLCRSFF
jgi:hypothetical protein